MTPRPTAAPPYDGTAALDVLGEPNRRLLLVILAERGECTVGELVAAAGLRQPQVSKHLKTLAEAALVQVRPEGRRRHYRLDGRGLKGAHDWFVQFEAVWQQRFDALDALASGDRAGAASSSSSSSTTTRGEHP